MGKVRGNFKIQWVRMGRADHRTVYRASRGLRFSDLFDAGALFLHTMFHADVAAGQGAQNLACLTTAQPGTLKLQK